MRVRQLIKNLKRLGDPDAEVVFMAEALVLSQRQLAGFKTPVPQLDMTAVAIPIDHVLSDDTFEHDGQRFVILATDP